VTSAEGALLDELTAWLEENWTPELTVRVWWGRLAADGWAMPRWPEGLGGRGLGAGDARAVARRLAAAGAVGPPTGVGQTMGGPTVLAHGTDEQITALVPALADGTEAWCQLFSEPGAGSDLAGLSTSAVRDGDEWVVNGQKVWNSGAHLAARGLLLARTDPAVPKHDGISYFVIDMDQPGVEVRPLRQMNGESEFCEVFLTDARVRADRMIGAPGEGWRVAQTTLAYERAGVGASGAPTVTVVPGALAGHLDRTCAEVLDAAARSSQRVVSGFVVGNGALQELARRAGRAEEPVVRQGLARFKSMTEVNRFNGLRGRATASRTGRPGPEGSIAKLAMSTIARRSRELTFSLLGAEGMLAGDDAPGDGAYVDVALASFGASLGGGTDEIQRNVIAERTLGLPREPSVDKGRPFAAALRSPDDTTTPGERP
jgi:alkylation response protein AidB-like acyl-CoA dehydrogenase